MLLTLAAFEVYLRATGFSAPVLHRLETERGWAPWPGVDGTYAAEGGARVRFNSAGMRGLEIPVAKPQRTFRIAVLGDSLTEAREVEEDETFAARLGDGLAACPALAGREVEVLNFGVSGYGTAQELLTLEHHALPFSPDLVLLAFFPGNDVANNSRALDGHPDRPYFVLRDGALATDRATLDTPRFAIKRLWRNPFSAVVNHVRVFQFADDLRAKLRHGRGRGDPLTPETTRSVVAEVLHPPADPDWEAAWAVTERLLAEFGKRSHAAGARFAIAVLSIPPEVHPDPAFRRAFLAAQGIESFGYPRERLSDFAAREGIPFVALGPAMAEAALADGAFYHGFEGPFLGDGHYNARGHAVAGRLLAEGLCRSLPPNGPRSRGTSAP